MKRRKLLYILSCGFVFVLLVLSCSGDKSTNPGYSTYADVVISVVDDVGNAVVGATVTTVPETQAVVTDNEGKAVLPNTLIRPYNFFIKRTGYPTVNQYVELNDNTIHNISFILDTYVPKAEILFPKNENFLSVYDLRFIGRGTDLEDGQLDDTALFWTSSKDGDLGQGKELMLESPLSIGIHSISLTAVDSDGKVHTTSILVTVVDYNPESYFPYPLGAQWNYQHYNRSFSVVNNEGIIETWNLNNIDVRIEENNKRISAMIYYVKVKNTEKKYQYLITDYLEKNGDDIYVNKTTEKLEVWKNNFYGSPSELLNIETTYNPPYLLLASIIDPQQNSSYENTVRTAVLWSFKETGTSTQSFNEDFSVTTSVSISQLMVIDTPLGLLESIPVIIEQDASKRIWWLVKGMGIVKLEYNSFSTPPIADLYGTNLSSYMNVGTNTQKITDTGYTTAIVEDPDTGPLPAADTPERLRAMSKILKNLSPR